MCVYDSRGIAVRTRLHISEGRKDSIVAQRTIQPNPRRIKEEPAEGVAARSHQ